jgi:hypothetical protein
MRLLSFLGLVPRKQYLAFVWVRFEEIGGWHDFYGAFDSAHEARVAISGFKGRDGRIPDPDELGWQIVFDGHVIESDGVTGRVEDQGP